MIYLFSGNEYLINESLSRLINTDADSVSVFEGVFPISQIKSEVMTLPFFSQKQIIVLKKFLKSKDKEGQKEIAEILDKLPATTDLIFVESELDERLSLLKQIKKLGKVQLYGELKGFELSKWIVGKVSEKGGEISSPLADKLGVMTGGDLTRLDNEITKLINYCPNITEEAVAELVDEGFFESIFSFIDALSEKNSKKAIRLINKMMAEENNELYLLSMLARQSRNLLIIKDLSKDNNEVAITKITKLHPFVVKKTLSQTKNFEIEKLIELHEAILESDIALKTTSVDPKIILTKLVYTFCST